MLSEYMGGFYGVEIYSTQTRTLWWWNGSGWVKGELPVHLRGRRALCIHRREQRKDLEAMG